MGHGAGGLLERWGELELFNLRAIPLPGLPLGRGWDPGAHRPGVPALLLPGLLERAGPSSERAALRPLRLRGQPRRGCEGMLFLSRRHADQFLAEGDLQISPSRVSL